MLSTQFLNILAMLLKCFKVLSIQAVLTEVSPPEYCYQIVNECYMNNYLDIYVLLHWIELSAPESKLSIWSSRCNIFFCLLYRPVNKLYKY